MEKLTEAQRKQVIEYFATKAAEEMPVEEVDQPDHLDQTRLEVQAAIGKQLSPPTWDALVYFFLDAQKLDRDPGGHLNELDEADTEANRNGWHDYYSDMIGTLIDRLA